MKAQPLIAFAALLTTMHLACSGATQEQDPTTQDMTSMDTPEQDMPASMMPDTPQDYSGIVINEVAAAGEPNDWFELINTGTQDVDLTGCTYTDDMTDPAKAVFAAGTIIKAGERLSFDASDETAGFKLGGDEELHLFDPAGQSIDSVDWDEGNSPEGGSFARLPDGTGAFAATSVATRDTQNMAGEVITPEELCGNGAIDPEEACDGTLLGDATCEAMGFVGGMLSCNACKLDTQMCEAGAAEVSINEVTSAGDDQIELFNSGALAATLDDWFVADSSYPEDMESRYVFPAGTTLEPGAFFVLTKDMEHAFGVGKDDIISLYNAEGTVVDQVAIPEDDAEVSYCRSEDGAGDWMTCSVATFGATNTP